MSAAVQEPPRNEKSGVSNKDTGFPEPLSLDRNTTLSHPDADTSKTACLEAADIPLSRTSSRLSFRGHRSKSGQHKSNSNAHVPTIANFAGDTAKHAADLPRDSGVDMGLRTGDSISKDAGGDAAGTGGVAAGRKSADSLSSEEEDDGKGGRRKKRGLRGLLHLK